jgi:cytochrome c-type biogenesis protein CcmH/NrfG
VNLKSAVIAAATIAVAAFALYLFIQVRATPARANATQVTQRPPTPHQEAAEPARPKPPAPPKEMVKPKLLQDPNGSGQWWKSPQLGREVDGPPAPTQVDDVKAGLKQDNLMELANKAYDGQDFDQATAIAQKVLSKDPTNFRMLRIVVSSNCIQGDSVVAQQAYEKLPKADREQMQTRCDRYGVSFKEPAQ